jgi:multiple sugar transport system substrate-binding protein
MWRAMRLAALVAAVVAVHPVRADELAFANDKPIFKIGFDAMVAAAKQKAGVSLRLDTYAPTDKYIATIQASVASDALPQLFTWWNGSSLKDIVASGRVQPLDAEWDAAVKSGDFAPQTGDLFREDGHVWGIPLGYARWVVLYNRKLFAQAGIAGAPATWDELLDDAAKLKAHGITPIYASIQSGWRAFTWFEEIMIRTNPDAYRGLFTGKVAYDGPEVREAFRIWGDLYAKGYMSDPRSNQEVVDVAAGKGAIYLMGEWVIGALANAGLHDDDLGVFIMPRINPAAQDSVIVEGGPILVAKATANNTDVKKAVAFLMSKDLADVLSQTQGLYVGNLKSAPRSKLISDVNAAMEARHPVVLTRWWEASPVELQTDLSNELGKFTLDPTPANATRVMSNMQALNKEYWANH